MGGACQGLVTYTGSWNKDRTGMVRSPSLVWDKTRIKGITKSNKHLLSPNLDVAYLGILALGFPKSWNQSAR